MNNFSSNSSRLPSALGPSPPPPALPQPPPGQNESSKGREREGKKEEEGRGRSDDLSEGGEEMGEKTKEGGKKAAVVIKNNSEWGEEKKWRIKIQDGGAEGRAVQGGGDGASRLEIPPPSPARKSPPGSLAETPRGGGEDQPP